MSTRHHGLNPDHIADSDPLRHQTLRHNKLKAHLTRITHFNMSSRFNLLDLFVALHANPDFRLLTPSHNLHHLLCLCSRDNLFNFDN